VEFNVDTELLAVQSDVLQEALLLFVQFLIEQFDEAQLTSSPQRVIQLV
jgi:hypothetical protein